MHKEFIKKSIQQMSADVNIVRLTFLTSFFHSMVVTLLLILNTNKLLVQHYENGLYVGKIAEFLIQAINKNHVVAWVIVITILLFLLYSFIYPIGQAAVIHYLHWQKSMKHSLRSVFTYFFPMFEYGFICLVFYPVSFFITAYKVFLLDGARGWGTFLIFGIWFVGMMIVNTLKIYTRYFIVLQQMPLYEALKMSIKTAWKNYKQTNRAMQLQAILLVNFSLNLIFIIGIPFLLMYGAISWGIISIWWVRLLVYVIFFILVIVSAYISSFIRAFFAYYWYEMYKKIKA